MCVFLSGFGVCRISYIGELSSSQYVTASSSIRPFFTDTIEVGILRFDSLYFQCQTFNSHSPDC